MTIDWDKIDPLYLKKLFTQKFKILSKFQLFWAIVVICNPYPSGSKVRHTGWNFLGQQIALQMTCNGQIAEPNPNEHVLAGALQGNLQLSPNFFWNFSHHICMFLTLRQGFLTIFWIFQTGLVRTPIINFFLSINCLSEESSKLIFFLSPKLYLAPFKTEV